MKINKNKIWAVLEQMVFAIFIIVVLYAVGFAGQIAQGRGLTPKEMHNASDAAAFIGGVSLIKYNTIYALSIAGIVIAFAGIIMPAISLFYENKKTDLIMGWTTLVFDIASLALITAAISIWAKGLTADGVARYDKGYLAGQYILTFVGAGIAFAGIGISYKDNLLKWD